MGFEQFERKTRSWLLIWRFIAGLAIWSVSVISSAEYGATWNVRWTNDGQLVEGGSSLVVLLGMLTCNYVVFFFVLVARHAAASRRNVPAATLSFENLSFPIDSV